MTQVRNKAKLFSLTKCSRRGNLPYHRKTTKRDDFLRLYENHCPVSLLFVAWA